MSFERLGKHRFEKRKELLNTVGNVGTVGKVIRSKKDRANDPRLQRKNKKTWMDSD